MPVDTTATLLTDLLAKQAYADAVIAAASKLGARSSDIPGLWNAPGYPELTTNQLLTVASR